MNGGIPKEVVRGRRRLLRLGLRLEVEEAWKEQVGVDAMVNPVKICKFVAIFFVRESSNAAAIFIYGWIDR